MQKFNRSYFNFVTSLYSKVYSSDERFLLWYKDNVQLNWRKKDSKVNSNNFETEYLEDRLHLISQGWKESDLLYYTQIRLNMLEIKLLCDKYYFTLFLSNYSNIVSKYNVTNNLITRYIEFEISKIIHERIRFFLQNHKYEIVGFTNYILPVDQTRYPSYTNIIFNVSQGVNNIFYDLFNTFYKKPLFLGMEHEMNDLIHEFLDLIDISTENTKIWIQHLNGLNRIISNKGNQSDKYDILVRDSSSLLKDILYEHFDKNGRLTELRKISKKYNKKPIKSDK